MTETQMRICPDVPDLTPEEWAAREEERVRKIAGSHLWVRNYNVLTRPKAKARRKRPVVCVELGRTFDTLTEAAEWVGLRPSAIHHAMKRGTKSAGYHWRYAEAKVTA